MIDRYELRNFWNVPEYRYKSEEQSCLGMSVFFFNSGDSPLKTVLERPNESSSNGRIVHECTWKNCPRTSESKTVIRLNLTCLKNFISYISLLFQNFYAWEVYYQNSVNFQKIKKWLSHILINFLTCSLHRNIEKIIWKMFTIKCDVVTGSNYKTLYLQLVHFCFTK